jgi:hypothetical protein
MKGRSMTATTTDSPIDVPLACSLTAKDLAERRVSNDEVFAAVEEVMELEDGHAFRFPNDPTWIARIVELIAAERACCPFFRFALSFEPNQGPVWLQVQGPPGVKDFTRELS